MATLTPEAEHILAAQTIDDNGPGTVSRDFKTLLAFIGSTRAIVSSKNNLLPMASLAQLNAQMTHPIQLALKRPMQKSYPHINALYLLLRTTGLASIEGTGSKPYLVLDEAVLESWRQLNPTEQYFTLLEAWLLKGRPEIVGERRGGFFHAPIVGWIRFFQQVPENGLQIAGNRGQEESIMYIPGLLNVAMFDLFGLVVVQHGKPKPGKGWSIAILQRTPWGNAMLQLLSEDLMNLSFLSRLDDDLDVTFGALQDIIQPYFPEWRHNLSLPEPEFQDGTYIFKVSLGRIWRRIAIPAKHDLESLSDSIRGAFEFDDDHLYAFYYKNRFGARASVHHPYMDEPPFTTDVQVGDLPLQPGATMTYLYDFGDHWEFDVQLERIDPVDLRLKKPRILETHGRAPEQYSDWPDR
jgi:hypothetical protein